MRTTVSAVLLILCIPAGFSDGFFDGLTGSSEGQVTSSKPRNVIPPKSGGKTLSFGVQSVEEAPISPAKGKVRFDPYEDAADFTNFASASVVDGKLVRKKDVNGGTCFGISYFTAMWYSRLIRPIQQGKKPNLFKIHQIEIGMWDALWTDVSKAGKSEYDGVTFVTLGVTREDAKKGKSFFKTTKMKEKIGDYRLYSMSHGQHKKKIQLGAISHHNDQKSISRISIDGSDPSDTSRKMKDLKSRVDKHGSQTFYYHKYKVTDSWYTWNKWEWGHACLIYEIQRVAVKAEGKAKRTAWKIRYMDPNALYHKRVPKEEGFGTYMLYFPDSKQVTFSKHVKDWYGIQTRNSVIDNVEVKLGYYDVYEGHSIQKKLAKTGFLTSTVGQGRVLTAEEEA
ncbi:hypothetical protein HOF92_10395, partial [bacterium]|nr:hypothetical protein [bacterium]